MSKEEKIMSFFLMNFDTSEYIKISTLIQKHGGRISKTQECPVITLSNSSKDTNLSYPVFHADYIEECVKCREVLNLVDFRLGGPRMLWGCSIGCIYAETDQRCPRSDDHTRCRTSTQIHPNTNHDYAQLQSTFHEKTTSKDISSDSNVSPGETSPSPITVTENINLIPEQIDFNNNNPGPSGIVFEKKANNGKKSPDDSILISDSDSSRSDDETTSASSRVSLSAKAKHANSSQSKKAKHILPPRNFSTCEQWVMIKYLIKNNCIAAARGNRVWKRLLADGLLPNRTFHSLNNHFRKLILPKISSFKMHPDHATQFRKLSRH